MYDCGRTDIKIMLILSVFLAILLMLMVSFLTRFFVFNKVIPRALIVCFMAFVVIAILFQFSRNIQNRCMNIYIFLYSYFSRNATSIYKKLTSLR